MTYTPPATKQSIYWRTVVAKHDGDSNNSYQSHEIRRCLVNLHKQTWKDFRQCGKKCNFCKHKEGWKQGTYMHIRLCLMSYTHDILWLFIGIIEQIRKRITHYYFRPGIEVTKSTPPPSFSYFPIFSGWWKRTLALKYYVCIRQVSPELSCGETCQLWMWSIWYSR